jgi:hypothetical protein
VGVDDTMISHEVVRMINNQKMLYSKNNKQLTCMKGWRRIEPSWVKQNTFLEIDQD